MDNKQAPKELYMTQCIIQKHSDRHEEHAELEEQERACQREVAERKKNLSRDRRALSQG